MSGSLRTLTTAGPVILPAPSAAVHARAPVLLTGVGLISCHMETYSFDRGTEQNWIVRLYDDGPDVLSYIRYMTRRMSCVCSMREQEQSSVGRRISLIRQT